MEYTPQATKCGITYGIAYYLNIFTSLSLNLYVL